MSAHRNPDVRKAVEGAGGHLRYLLAYSPDVNPISLACSKRKTHLRGVVARSFAPLLAAIGTGLDDITATDSRGYYAHCGFPLADTDKQPS